MSHRKRDLRVLPPETPEFAPGVDEPPDELDRRAVMKLLAAGAGLAGLGSIAACMEAPSKRIMPRVEQPPELVPGVPLEYATSMVIDGFATGLLVTTYEARPTKVEGNPDHPASLGATSQLHQASVLELYDPDRPQGALEAGVPTSLEVLLRTIARRAAMPGLWFLLHPQSSPLTEELIGRVRARHPTARFAWYSALDRRAVYEGTRRVFGRPLEPQYRFELADVIVSLDADFLAGMANSVRWARDFAARRRLRAPEDPMSRLYIAEPGPSPTGSLADHALAARPTELRGIAAAILARLEGRADDHALSPRQRRWVDAAAADLRAGRGLVVAGERQPAEVHALAHLINEAIGAHGTTVVFTAPAVIDPLGPGLPELAEAIRRGAVQTLVIAEANPVYSAPPELDFAALLARVPETICSAVAHNETSRRCRWFVPLAHYLESWGDARAYDGTISMIQPLIRPMYQSATLPDLLAAFAGTERPDTHRMLLDRYAHADPLAWQRLLQRGVVDGDVPRGEAPQVQLAVADRQALVAPVAAAPTDDAALELSFAPSHAVHDGRFAGISWLQEMPKPIHKITWGNAALLSPATAAALGVRTDDVVRITIGKTRVELPVYVVPGHAERCVTLELGYGRWAATPTAEGVGANVYPLRPLATPAYAIGARVVPTGRRSPLAQTQQHFTQDRRDIAPSAELETYRAKPDLTAHLWGELPTWLPDRLHGTPQWAMTIDTMICSGCSACVVACQAENNVPVVGAAGVRRNREMHWLRIDTYREQQGDRVAYVHQPMLCQHCELAPCEYVCPVYATQHSPDGLNEMVYNRCIGTRFCSNNCPYKVRRFNWFDFTQDTPNTLRLQYNPNVTVRARGVMEKCTYCVQRIRAAEIRARKANREILPGEVVTACQQACPTGAIQFGQLQHEETEMVKWRKQPRHYAVLHDLNTRPRTAYLAKITNPKPRLP
jgi:Fe-S-cluster-containing dehydrogenase component/anaerobic selenocysteine-containing dehydrogenase